MTRPSILDIFNNEIVGYDVRESEYGNGTLNYKNALQRMLETKIKRGYEHLETIFHSNQGAVYSSLSFNKNREKPSFFWYNLLDKKNHTKQKNGGFSYE